MTAIDCFFELAEELMCVTRRDGYIDLANESFGRAVGASSVELIGRSVEELVHSEDCDEVRDRLSKLMRGQTTRFEARLRCGDRVHRSYTWHAKSSGTNIYVVAREGGAPEVRGLRVVARPEPDAVDRTRLEILSHVGHELRTPLTSVRGSLGLLEGGVVGQLDGGVARLVAIARTNTDRMIRLVDEALDRESLPVDGGAERPQSGGEE